MSIINVSAFALGSLFGGLSVAVISIGLWPLAEWEKTARWRWAGGHVTFINRLKWRLFRPVVVSAAALLALGGAA